MGREKELSGYLFGSNAPYIEELYQIYINDSDQLDESWRKYFDELNDSNSVVNSAFNPAAWAPRKNWIIGCGEEGTKKEVDKDNSSKPSDAMLSGIAIDLINAYRFYGHIEIDYDPLQIEKHEIFPPLHKDYYNLSDEQMREPININGHLGLGETNINEVIEKVRKIYSSCIGIEFMHIESYEEKAWFEKRMETSSALQVGIEEKKQAFFDLIEAESFESFLHTKFPGAKRFSIEGCEASICATEKIIECAALNNTKEVVIGMSHRGRLNTLTKIMGKPYHAMFAEFQGRVASPGTMNIAGDVKYHQGASADIDVRGNKLHLSLTANPSHLEAVNSVVQGRVRAKQDQLSDKKREQVLGLLIHGDAAFSGQGSVFESLALSGLEAYHTGGIIHIVANNQIGFTTLPQDSRASRYCTDVAKSISSPILHINANDIEAVVFACKMAIEYRNAFKKDIVIDIIGYRKYGHNEGDEPKFTQPLMYEKIAQQKPADVIYRDKLIADKIITMDDYDKYKGNFKTFLNDEFELSKNYNNNQADWLEGKWKGFEQAKIERENERTGVSIKILKMLGDSITNIPEGFSINSKIMRQMQAKKQMLEKGAGIDWGTAEALAFATLLKEGYPVRITGQDAKRGTFSHRHAVLFDQKTEVEYTPLNNLSSDQLANLEIYNSNLSEFGVLGFEYGYSLTEPNCLTIWEAQFGDFSNSAQVIIDQYISSGEAKWLRMNGLVMLLPHGYEGQGPEHSSARLERYLQLCANDNMQVVNCTTPASIFHALRRQIHRKFRKPLIVMSPKSLLRHKLAVSNLDEMGANSYFQTVIGEIDTELVSDDKIKRIVVCTGKVYYDLYEARQQNKVRDVVIIRLEQLYPFMYEDFIAKTASKYKNAIFIWCQEEPKNMGAYFYIDSRIEKVLTQSKHKCKRAVYAGREVSASPASGYTKQHIQEQGQLVCRALGIKK